MAERRAFLEWLTPRVDFCASVGGVITLLGLLWIGISTGFVGPELVENLFVWPAKHTQVLMTVAMVVAAGGVVYRALTIDVGAELMASDAIRVFNNPSLDEPSRMHSKFTMEVVYAVKLRLGTPKRTEANIGAVHRECARYIREQTKEGGPREGMRLSHQHDHLVAAIAGVFEPNDFQLEVQRRTESHRMRARRKILHHEKPDFIDALATGLRFGRNPVSRLNELSRRRRANLPASTYSDGLLIDLQNAPTTVSTSSTLGNARPPIAVYPSSLVGTPRTISASTRGMYGLSFEA